jgi:hypothetical protein
VARQLTGGYFVRYYSLLTWLKLSSTVEARCEHVHGLPHLPLARQCMLLGLSTFLLLCKPCDCFRAQPRLTPTNRRAQNSLEMKLSFKLSNTPHTLETPPWRWPSVTGMSFLVINCIFNNSIELLAARQALI